jgi:hypothetical protein
MTLLVEWSSTGVADPQARALARVFAKAMADRHSVVFTGRISLDSPLALAADETLIVDGSSVLAQDTPAEVAARTQSHWLSVAGQVDKFVESVRAAGGRADLGHGTARTQRVRVDLGPLAIGDLFRIAAESNAVVIELRSICTMFA